MQKRPCLHCQPLTRSLYAVKANPEKLSCCYKTGMTVTPEECTKNHACYE